MAIWDLLKLGTTTIPGAMATDFIGNLIARWQNRQVGREQLEQLDTAYGNVSQLVSQGQGDVAALANYYGVPAPTYSQATAATETAAGLDATQADMDYYSSLPFGKKLLYGLAYGVNQLFPNFGESAPGQLLTGPMREQWETGRAAWEAERAGQPVAGQYGVVGAEPAKVTTEEGRVQDVKGAMDKLDATLAGPWKEQISEYVRATGLTVQDIANDPNVQQQFVNWAQSENGVTIGLAEDAGLIGQMKELRGEVLGRLETLGQTEHKAIDKSYAQLGASGRMDLMTAGLTGTTVMGSWDQAVERERTEAHARADERIESIKAGFEWETGTEVLTTQERMATQVMLANRDWLLAQINAETIFGTGKAAAVGGWQIPYPESALPYAMAYQAAEEAEQNQGGDLFGGIFTGGLSGALAGSAFGPWGTLIGGTLGGTAGGFAGQSGGGATQSALYSAPYWLPYLSGSYQNPQFPTIGTVQTRRF